jgi:hypothetical protein
MGRGAGVETGGAGESSTDPGSSSTRSSGGGGEQTGADPGSNSAASSTRVGTLGRCGSFRMTEGTSGRGCSSRDAGSPPRQCGLPETTPRGKTARRRRQGRKGAGCARVIEAVDAVPCTEDRADAGQNGSAPNVSRRILRKVYAPSLAGLRQDSTARPCNALYQGDSCAKHGGSLVPGTVRRARNSDRTVLSENRRYPRAPTSRAQAVSSSMSRSWTATGVNTWSVFRRTSRRAWPERSAGFISRARSVR